MDIKEYIDVNMHLEKCPICGQRGFLELWGERVQFCTTDGMGQFYGQLIHVMANLLGLPRTHCDGHTRAKLIEQGNRQYLLGRVIWDYLGVRSEWILRHDVTASENWHEDFILELCVRAYEEGKETSRVFQLPFRDFCYAVTQCGTKLLKEYGIIGYMHLAEEFEDMNIREFLQLKAFALNAEAEMGYVLPSREKSSLEKELELLLFDM